MSNIKEDYVSFDVAKLLKNKGFDGGCDMYYTETGSVEYTQLRFNHNEIKNHYSRPTHQMAMKWLREVHNVMIVPIPISFKKKGGYNKWKCELYIEGVFENMNSKFSTYEEACEASIKYTLENLI